MRGVANLGNTCYLGAAVQCLAHCPPLLHFVRHAKHAHRTDAMRALAVLVERLWMRDDDSGTRASPSLSPAALMEQLRGDLFLGAHQQDLHEALLALVDATGLDVCPAGLLVGQMEVVVSCGRCGRSAARLDPVLGLSVPFCATLEQALESHSRTTLVAEWQCEHCGRADVSSEARTRVKQAPELLVVHVKRFNVHGVKIAETMAFGEHLTLDGHRYVLHAVAVHVGHSLDAGHYVARCRVAADEWVEFDDSRVFATPLDTVLASEAYVLFYCRARQEPVVDGAEARGDDESLWVVPALWWMRHCAWSAVDDIGDEEWKDALVVGVPEHVARRWRGKRRM